VPEETKAMFEKLKIYIQESYHELMTRVSWPTWKDLQSSALVVAVAAILIALLIGVMDGTANVLFTKLLYKLAG
jgi:preprotein translocase subunit SecE